MPPPKVKPGRLAAEVWRLAWKDLVHDARASLVLVLTVAAIAAPLLLLLGLRNGVVATLRDTLVKDPRNLEVVIYGSARLDRDWLEELQGHPEAAFLVPKTRSINASIDLLDGEGNRLIPGVELIPTAHGDPLLPTGTPIPGRPDQVLITETLAEQLDSEQPSSLSAIVRRTLDGERQQLRLPLTVVGVVPSDHFSRDALFTTLDLLVATEDYRDGLLTDSDGDKVASGYSDARALFANARLYANGLEAVEPLAKYLRAAGIEVRTQAERIRTLQAFDRILTFVFRVIALVGGIGGVLALGGALWANVERKRRPLALLRLFGFGRGAVASVPLIQGLLIAGSGLLIAGAGYLVGAAVFDSVIGRNLEDGYVCRLEPVHTLLAVTTVVLAALLASLAGAARAGRVSPAEGLRETIL